LPDPRHRRLARLAGRVGSDAVIANTLRWPRARCGWRWPACGRISLSSIRAPPADGKSAGDGAASRISLPPRAAVRLWTAMGGCAAPMRSRCTARLASPHDDCPDADPLFSLPWRRWSRRGPSG